MKVNKKVNTNFKYRQSSKYDNMKIFLTQCRILFLLLNLNEYLLHSEGDIQNIQYCDTTDTK